MAEQNNKAAKAAVGISAGAAVLAALSFLQRKASASPGEEGVVEIPAELWNLIIAIAQSGEDITAGINSLASALSELSLNVKGYPPNAEYTAALRFECTLANQPYHLPDLAVPDGFSLHLLAWPFNPPGGLISVGRSAAEAGNMNQSYPMVPGSTKDYFVQNASTLFVSATIVPAWIVMTAEQRR